VLADSGVSLGDIYPRPIVDHDAARRRALAAFAAIRGGGNDDETGRTKR
jgi:deoxyribodipyrimidine photo-lyase